MKKRADLIDVGNNTLLGSIFKIIAALSVISLNQVAQAAQTASAPAAALGCKLVSGYGFEHRYVILYKHKDNSEYSRVCVDTLEGASMDSYKCIRKIHQDADSIMDISPYRAFIIQRDSLRLALSHNFSGVSTTRTSCNSAAFNKTCGVYQCEISPNINGTMIAIEKAKKKELSVNKI